MLVVDHVVVSLLLDELELLELLDFFFHIAFTFRFSPGIVAGNAGSRHKNLYHHLVGIHSEIFSPYLIVCVVSIHVHQFRSSVIVYGVHSRFAYNVVSSVIGVFSKSNGVFSCHVRYRYWKLYQSRVGSDGFVQVQFFATVCSSTALHH